jgi:hypothetical protein
MNERKVEKHAVRHDKSEDGESKQGFLLASAKRLHLFRRVCAQPAIYEFAFVDINIRKGRCKARADLLSLSSSTVLVCA